MKQEDSLLQAAGDEVAFAKPESTPPWPEVESRVHVMGGNLLLAVAVLFGAAGSGGLMLWATADLESPDKWIILALPGSFLLFGLAMIAELRKRARLPSTVRHAAANVLPDVSREPVLREGSEVKGLLTHELVQDGTTWKFIPREGKFRIEQHLLLGFGIFFAACVSWVFHNEAEIRPWPLAILCGIAVTLLCGGTVTALIWAMQRASHRRLSVLWIHEDQNELELDLAENLDINSVDFNAGTNWLLGAPDRRQFRIPREVVAAVQLCPWYFVIGEVKRSSTYAAQGLLVLRNDAAEGYLRIPVLLTGDLLGAALLMQRLATVLQVPYLFSGDFTGWNAELRRAKHRPPLRAGGISHP